VMNNISVDNAVYPAYNGIACSRRTGNIGIYDSAPATTTMDYNLVNLTASGDLYVWAGNSYSSPAALFAVTGQEAHGIQADPKWINSAGANFRLQSGSRAIDSANSGAASEPAAIKPAGAVSLRSAHSQIEQSSMMASMRLSARRSRARASTRSLSEAG